MEVKKKIMDGELLELMTERLDYDIFALGQCAPYAMREGYLVENDGVETDIEGIAQKNGIELPEGRWMSYI